MCECKQVPSFLSRIKVSSLSAPPEIQRAGGSLGSSALPWATYQTAWMSAGRRLCVCVCTESKRCSRNSGWLFRRNAFLDASTVTALSRRADTRRSGRERTNQLAPDDSLVTREARELGKSGECNRASRALQILVQPRRHSLLPFISAGYLGSVYF